MKPELKKPSGKRVADFFIGIKLCAAGHDDSQDLS